MVHHTLPKGLDRKPAIVFGTSFIFIPSRQAHTTLQDALQFLKLTKEDSVVLMLMPMTPVLSPELRNRKYMTLLPTSGDPNIDRGPPHCFAAAYLPVASSQGPDAGMAVCVKLPPCFGSSKQSKNEMLSEAALLWGPLWPNVNYVERTTNGQAKPRPHGRPICQMLIVKLAAISSKMQYTDLGGPAPLTLVACHPGWKDFLDLDEMVNEMADRLMQEDARSKGAPSRRMTLLSRSCLFCLLTP